MTARPKPRSSSHSPLVGADQRISVCQQCGQTVWSWEPHRLSTGQVLGIVHVECPEAS